MLTCKGNNQHRCLASSLVISDEAVQGRQVHLVGEALGGLAGHCAQARHGQTQLSHTQHTQVREPHYYVKMPPLIASTAGKEATDWKLFPFPDIPI